MKIYIPTHGRDRLRTLENLLPHTELTLVVRPEEAGRWASRPRNIDLLVVDAVGVAAARQGAIVHALKKKEDKVFFLDDDLIFSHRPNSWSLAEPKLAKSSPKDVARALVWMEKQLNDFAAVGFGPRAMNQTIEQDRVSPARMMRSFGVRADILKKHGVRFDRFKYWEDFHVTLELLKLGYPNCISAKYVSDAQTNAVGGCSTYRDLRELKKTQTDFVQLHRTFAQAVTKKASSWGGGLKGAEVPELRMSWVKALAYGVLKHGKRKL